MLKNLLKKWYFWVIIAFLIIAIPLIINFMYLNGYNNSTKINTMVDANTAMLSYFSLLSVFGSAFLGCVALYQNNKLMSLYESEKIQSESCYVLGRPRDDENNEWNPDCDIYNQIYNEIIKTKIKIADKQRVCIILENAGKSILAKMNIIYVYNRKPNKIVYQQLINITLAPGSLKKIEIPMISNEDIDGFAFEFISVFNKKTYGSCTLDAFITSLISIDCNYSTIEKYSFHDTCDDAIKTPKMLD